MGEIIGMIESRTYLLESQKERLVGDLGTIPLDDKRIEEIIDTVFFRLFGKGWDALTDAERRDIRDAWRGV